MIIADFYEPAARHIMCQAYRLEMTQAQGYVWFIPGWYREGWFDLDLMKRKKHLNEVGNIGNIKPSRRLDQHALKHQGHFYFRGVKGHPPLGSEAQIGGNI